MSNILLGIMYLGHSQFHNLSSRRKVSMSSAAVMPFKTKVSPPGIGKDETKTKAKRAKGKEVKNFDNLFQHLNYEI